MERAHASRAQAASGFVLEAGENFIKFEQAAGAGIHPESINNLKSRRAPAGIRAKAIALEISESKPSVIPSGIFSFQRENAVEESFL